MQHGDRRLAGLGDDRQRLVPLLVVAVLVVVAALVVAAALPLVAVLPAWGGAGVWILVAVVGLLGVGAATLVEKGRLAARAARSCVGEWTAGWE